MKLTAKNIVLIILVLGVWSFVGYRAYNYFNPTIIEENTEENKITSLNHNISPQSNYIINDLDYIDPFLKEKKSNKRSYLSSPISSSNVLKNINPRSIKGNNNRTNTSKSDNSIVWPLIEYKGVFENPDLDKKIGLITINGKELMINKDEQGNEVQLKELRRDSILLSYKGQFKWFKK